jgi:hypothetical protein
VELLVELVLLVLELLVELVLLVLVLVELLLELPEHDCPQIEVTSPTHIESQVLLQQ